MNNVDRILKGYISTLKNSKPMTQAERNKCLSLFDKYFSDTSTTILPSHLRDKKTMKFFNTVYKSVKSTSMNIPIKVNHDEKIYLEFYTDLNTGSSYINLNSKTEFMQLSKLISIYISSLISTNKNSMNISTRMIPVISTLCGNMYLNSIVPKEVPLKQPRNIRIVLQLFLIMYMYVFFGYDAKTVIDRFSISKIEIGYFNTGIMNELKTNPITNLDQIHEFLVNIGLVNSSEVNDGLLRMAKLFPAYALLLFDTTSPSNCVSSILYSYLYPDENLMINKYTGMDELINKNSDIMYSFLESITNVTLR